MDKDRIRFIVHKSQPILLCDLSHCTAAEVEKLSKLVPQFVTSRPKGSVLLLADFTGCEVDRKAATAMKEGTVFDRPYLKRSAWVGVESIPRVFFENIKTFSQRDLPTFKTREEALEWLVAEEGSR
jgi:hypothetical protein